jgi:hypothetical protein
MTNKNTIRTTAFCLAIGLLISACGQKGPLIVDRPPEDLTRTQEGLPNEISPDDGSESESEADVEVEGENADEASEE